MFDRDGAERAEASGLGGGVGVVGIVLGVLGDGEAEVAGGGAGDGFGNEGGKGIGVRRAIPDHVGPCDALNNAPVSVRDAHEDEDGGDSSERAKHWEECGPRWGGGQVWVGGNPLLCGGSDHFTNFGVLAGGDFFGFGEGWGLCFFGSRVSDVFAPGGAVVAAAIGDGIEGGCERVGGVEIGVIGEVFEVGGVEVFEDGFGYDIVAGGVGVDAIAGGEVGICFAISTNVFCEWFVKVDGVGDVLFHYEVAVGGEDIVVVLVGFFVAVFFFAIGEKGGAFEGL